MGVHCYPPPTQSQTPTPTRDGYFRGRRASCWNAFLLQYTSIQQSLDHLI